MSTDAATACPTLSGREGRKFFVAFVADYPLHWRARSSVNAAAIGVDGGGKLGHNRYAPRLAHSWLPLCKLCHCTAGTGERGAENAKAKTLNRQERKGKRREEG